jgi:hypothetical protein
MTTELKDVKTHLNTVLNQLNELEEKFTPASESLVKVGGGGKSSGREECGR